MSNAVRKAEIIRGNHLDENALRLAAISDSYATIEFDPTGTILSANELFLSALGYTLKEIVGNHHSMFVDTQYKNSKKYKDFWASLANGEPQSDEFKRVTKAGNPIWIKASYMPVRSAEGEVVKVIKLAQDNTKERLELNNFVGTVEAISRTQAVIEFDLEGKILGCNQNFLSAMGYSQEQVNGHHHSMFVDSEFKRSSEYNAFWQKLGRGEFVAGEFKRLGNNGKEVWLQASYNPVFDFTGKPFKVVKFAFDVTAQKLRSADFEGQLTAIGKSQAVIQFDLDGNVLEANDNFLRTLDYSMGDIRGKHHSMFVEDSYRKSPEYKNFWDTLRRGDFFAGQFKRISRSGKEVWIQASYNPIFDLNGKPFKVVKYATDITEQVKLMNEIKNLAIAAEQLSTASADLMTASSSLNESSRHTTTQASQAAVGAEEVSRGVLTVATNTEEMEMSIREIARNTSSSSQMSAATKVQAQEANLRMQKLGASSQEIGKVVKVISSIAQQTNLLALNATIEAARAGDAGRGFAVVANEVKELAKQSASATEEIAQRISSIQNDSKEAISAIDDISQSIEKLNNITGAIAASVEEQSATTREVARIVQESSKAVESIAGNIRGVSDAAGNATTGAKHVLESATSLSDLSTRLQDMVARLQKTGG